MEFEKMTIRIQRYRLRLMRYVIDMKYIQGQKYWSGSSFKIPSSTRNFKYPIDNEIQQLMN